MLLNLIFGFVGGLFGGWIIKVINNKPPDNKRRGFPEGYGQKISTPDYGANIILPIKKKG
ncbi:MAG: hypothetical protein LKF42_08720 [Streptococcaceae bacterium]|nr:hypothetical protein [Streptococcaceae bacterium]MCH4177294.1 hypothetical protein [Streptococcaceae bacterium]